jgi:hypothetical protein
MRLPYWFTENFWPWLCATWSGLLIGVFGGGLLALYDAFAVPLLLTFCCLLVLSAYKTASNNRLPDKFPVHIFAIVVFFASYWCINEITAPTEEKAERYDQIMTDWRADMHKEAVEQIKDYVLLDQMKH